MWIRRSSQGYNGYVTLQIASPVLTRLPVSVVTILIMICVALLLVLVQLCDYCKRLGATIRCQADGCLRFYHFPCSAASGSFQSMKLLALLCPEHIEKAEEIGE